MIAGDDDDGVVADADLVERVEERRQRGVGVGDRRVVLRHLLLAWRVRPHRLRGRAERGADVRGSEVGLVRLIGVDEEEERRGRLGAEPVDGEADGHRHPDGVVAVVLVIEAEAAREGRRIEEDVLRRGRGRVAGGAQALGEGYDPRGQWVAERAREAVHARIEPRQHRRVGGQGPGSLRDDRVEARALAGESIEHRRALARPAIRPDPVRAQRVERDQHHVPSLLRRIGGRPGENGISPDGMDGICRALVGARLEAESHLGAERLAHGIEIDAHVDPVAIGGCGGPVEAPIEDGGGPPRRIAGDDAGPGMAAPLERAGLEQGDGHAQRRTRVQRDGRRLHPVRGEGLHQGDDPGGILGDAREAEEDRLTGGGRAAEALDRDVGRCHHERRGAQTAQGVRAPDGNLEAPLRRAPCGGGQRRVDDERRERRETRSRDLVDGHERRDDPERRRDLVGERARREVPRWDGHHRGPRPEGNGQARGDDDPPPRGTTRTPAWRRERDHPFVLARIRCPSPPGLSPSRRPP